MRLGKLCYRFHSSHLIASILGHQIYSCYTKHHLLDSSTKPRIHLNTKYSIFLISCMRIPNEGMHTKKSCTRWKSILTQNKKACKHTTIWLLKSRYTTTLVKTTCMLSKYKDQYKMKHRHIEANMFDKMPKRNTITIELSNHSPKNKIVTNEWNPIQESEY